MILEREGTQKLLDLIKDKNPTLVSELLPDLVSVGIIQRTLQKPSAEKNFDQKFDPNFGNHCRYGSNH